MISTFGRNFTTAVVRMPDGKRVPIQVDDTDGLPIIADNVWLITERSPHRSVETVIGDIALLSIIGSWAHDHGISLSHRFRNETFLSANEIKSLVARLRERKRKTDKLKVISDQKWRTRFDGTSNYFRYLSIKHVKRPSPYSSSPLFSNFMRAWVQHRPRKSSRARVGLTPQQISFILEVTCPGHPRNPWQRRTQSRNRLIILLMLLCGLRLGEVLSLRMDDLRVRGSFPTIDIKRRLPDQFETRRVPPVPKTLGRRLPLCGKVGTAADLYILHDRVRTPRNASQPFLILSRDGFPCSKEAVQAMITVFRKSDPILHGLVGHRLRNSFTDLAQEALKTSRLNQEQMSDVLTYMGGWSKTSIQPGRYSQAWLDRQVDSIILSIDKSISDTKHD